MIFKRFSLIMLALIVLVSVAFGGDVANKTVYSNEEYSYVVYRGMLDYSATDSTDNLFTQAMFIGDCDMITSRGVLQIWVTGAVAMDVDVFIEGSNTLYATAFKSVRTDTLLNDIGAGVTLTPVITYVGSAFITRTTLAASISPVADPAGQGSWVRLKCDGQAGNEADVKVYFYLIVKKLVNAEKRGYPRISSTVTTEVLAE